MTLLAPIGAPPHRVCVSICTRCRDGRHGLCGARGGARLAAATQARLLDAPAAPIVLRRVACMSLCTRPCAIALSGPGRFTYLFGDLDPDLHAAAIVELAARYAALPQGFMARADRPEPFRAAILGRLPPLELAPSGGLVVDQPDW